eukprot:gene9927-7145_t
MVAALRGAGAAVEYSAADGSEGAPLAPQDLSGHDSWTQTYEDPAFEPDI